ncbi:MAG: phosphohydrolase [Gammaproteobacteria bacterium]|nr:MAG: phosphohydrolase [Gammaproteobacteria bacterium]
MSADFNETGRFFLELDALKHVERQSYITAPRRYENSAEHSWHLAMACWALAERYALAVDEGKLLKLALIHDLGEIDAGDTFLYADNRRSAHHAERAGIARLAGHTGCDISDLAALWEEQETGHSIEVKLLKAVDRLLPFLLNIANEGGSWQQHRIKRSQVMTAMAFIDNDFPEIHTWIEQQVQIAVHNGWLIDA